MVGNLGAPLEAGDEIEEATEHPAAERQFPASNDPLRFGLHQATDESEAPLLPDRLVGSVTSGRTVMN